MEKNVRNGQFVGLGKKEAAMRTARLCIGKKSEFEGMFWADGFKSADGTVRL
jgi:hypothetical protein